MNAAKLAELDESLAFMRYRTGERTPAVGRFQSLSPNDVIGLEAPQRIRRRDAAQTDTFWPSPDFKSGNDGSGLRSWKRRGARLDHLDVAHAEDAKEQFAHEPAVIDIEP